jgi:hypothetical protein
LRRPLTIGRIGNRQWRAVGCGQVNHGRGARKRSIHIAVEMIAAEERENLGTPKEIVVRGQLHRE